MEEYIIWTLGLIFIASVIGIIFLLVITGMKLWELCEEVADWIIDKIRRRNEKDEK